MKIIKRLVLAVISASFILSSAMTSLADETTPSTTTGSKSTTDLSKVTFESMYGSELPKYLGRQYVFEGQQIPVTESDYYILLTFMNLSQYAAYGYLPATSDHRIDLTATYGNNGEKYGDYLIEQAEKYLESTYILMKRAREAGMTLTDEDKQNIDKELNDMYEQQAKPSGITLDKAIKIYFGADCDEKAYRAIIENSTLAGKYQKKYIEGYAVPEDQKMIPSITYALHYAPESSASADDKAKAKAAAEAMLKSCKNIEDLKTVGANAKNAGTVRDAGTLPVQKGKMVPDFEAWAYEASRKEGEMAVIYAKEYGYFCVGYNGKVELDASEKQEMATKALSAEIDTEIKAGKYGFKYEGTAPKTNKNSNVLVIVFASVGGAAIILVVAILIMNSVKNNKGNGKKSSGSKKTGSGKKSSKGKSGKSK